MEIQLTPDLFFDEESILKDKRYKIMKDNEVVDLFTARDFGQCIVNETIIHTAVCRYIEERLKDYDHYFILTDIYVRCSGFLEHGMKHHVRVTIRARDPNHIWEYPEHDYVEIYTNGELPYYVSDSTSDLHIALSQLFKNHLDSYLYHYTRPFDGVVVHTVTGPVMNFCFYDRDPTEPEGDV